MDIIVKNNGQEEIYGITPEYPYVMHEIDTKDFFIPWHWHEELEFGYIAEGSVNVITNNGEYSFEKGEGFFCNSNVLCKMDSKLKSQRTIMYSHLFHAVFLGGHFKSVFESKYLTPVLSNKNIELIPLRGETIFQTDMLSKLYQISHLQIEQEDIEFNTRNLLSEIWILLLEEIKTNHTPLKNVDLKNQERILTMISYIHQHYLEKITLNAIADSANISNRECLRCFQKNIGKAPFEYLMDFRIAKASELLTYTDKPVVETGYESGFSSNSYFGKKFKEIKGMTPGDYRKRIPKNKDCT